ncbi:MAG: hypothetical protein ACTSU2_15765 [Promethearchaeota archaeon]
MIKEEDDDRILTKFSIAFNLMSFAMFYNSPTNLEMQDALFEFISPIMKPDEELKAKAYEQSTQLDLLYTEYKIIQYPKELLFIVYEGNRIRLCILMRRKGFTQKAAQYLIPILSDFVEDFEDMHSKELKKYTGDKSVFGNIEEMFRNELSLDLALPHYAKYVGFEPETKLGQYIFGAADLLTRKIGYFYLPNLIYATKKYIQDKARDLVMTNPKKAKKLGIDPDHIDYPPEDQFYITMYKLRRLGMLLPIKIEDLRSYSKIRYPPMKK